MHDPAEMCRLHGSRQFLDQGRCFTRRLRRASQFLVEAATAHELQR